MGHFGCTACLSFLQNQRPRKSIQLAIPSFFVGLVLFCPKPPVLIKSLLLPLFLMGCFPVYFQEVKRPLRTKSAKRPIKVGKRPINEGKRPIKAKVLVGVSVGCLMGCFRAPPPWQKTAPLKRPIKRSMSLVAQNREARNCRIAELEWPEFQHKVSRIAITLIAEKQPTFSMRAQHREHGIALRISRFSLQNRRFTDKSAPTMRPDMITQIFWKNMCNRCACNAKLNSRELLCATSVHRKYHLEAPPELHKVVPANKPRVTDVVCNWKLIIVTDSQNKCV